MSRPLANCNADNFGFNQTIIVFTDELNSEYLDDVEKILEEKGHRFLNGEAKVLELVLEMVVGNEFHDENAGNSTKKSVTKYLNNYFTFQARISSSFMRGTNLFRENEGSVTIAMKRAEFIFSLKQQVFFQRSAMF